MSTSSERTIRPQGFLAAALACIAGYIDSYTLLYYKVYASFMSGNTTQTGALAGAGKLTEAGYHMLPIPLFLVGVFAGTCLIESGLIRPLRAICGLVAALLVASLAAACLNPQLGWASIILLSLAMGVMNTGITHVGRQSVSLGFVTGDLNNLARHVALAVRQVPLSDSEGPWDTRYWRAAVLARVWISFLVGALVCGATTVLWGKWVLLPAVLLLLILAVGDRNKE